MLGVKPLYPFLSLLPEGVACGLGVRIARTVVDEAPALEPLMSSLPLAPEAFA